MNNPEQNKEKIPQSSIINLRDNGFIYSSAGIRIDTGRILTEKEFETRKQKAKAIKFP
jgi:hypothetical protein